MLGTGKLMIPDQRKLWNDGLDSMAVRLQEPSDFALEVLKFIKAGDKLLELGCGVGLDAGLFAQNGIKTLATDFADQTIAQNKATNKYNNLEFEILDITSKYPYPDETFDCVYACLSLHYFKHKQTKATFQEIHRILKPNGLLTFRCKSTTDLLYGEGDEIEADMFVRKGHVRHFFSVDYAKSLLEDFSILKLEEATGIYDGYVSNFIDCGARKT